jgi:hypothetical protein
MGDRASVPCLNVGHESLSINSFPKRSARNNHCASITRCYSNGIAIIVDGSDIEPPAGSIDAADGCPVPGLINLESADLWLKPDLRPQRQKRNAAECSSKSENCG